MKPGVSLDETQLTVLAHARGPLLVLGGPGTGKTTTLVELVSRRVAEGLDPSRVLLLTPTRRAGGELRDRVARRVGRTIREPLARTVHSYAFGLLRREAVRRGRATPRLLSAAEQDLMIAELLRGSHQAWPSSLTAALGTQSFAGQLRDLLLRAVERDLSPDELTRLAAAHDRPVWASAAAFADEYAQVTALAQPSAYDPAELVRAAVDLLRDEPDVRMAERAGRSLVVVDDIADADPALLDLVEEIAGDGHDLVATADPDTAVLRFRGVDPRAVTTFPQRFQTAQGEPAPVVVLGSSHRLPAAVLQATLRVADRLGGRGTGRARTSSAPGSGTVETAVLASGSEELSQVAGLLRRRHLADGVAWDDMAVLVRSAADLAAVRRGLARHGVPVAQRTEEVALWQQPAVRALLDLLAIACGTDPVTAQRLVDLLLGPLVGMDPARLSRVRRFLHAEHRRQGGTASADDVLQAAVTGSDDRLPQVDQALGRLADILAAGADAALTGSAEEVLWAQWAASDLAERWRRTALSGGPGSAAADRNLDAVVGLFEAAARFADRLPGAGPAAFLDHVRAQQVPGDAWATSRPVTDAVSVLTAHASAGQEWDTVAVCRVQEDLWPDLRRRSGLLALDDLVALLDAGRLPTPLEQVTALMAAERRLFYLAVTRARRALLVTAVDDGETQPSRLLDEIDPRPDDERGVVVAAAPLTLAALVAELRAVVCDPARTPADREEAAALLAVLADEEVPGADPDHWYGLAPVSDQAPLVDGEETVSLSPSQIEGYLRCPLRWMLQRAGGENGTALRQSVGTLIHQLAREAAEDDLDGPGVWARYEQLWASLDVGRGWVARRERARVDAMVTRLVRWLDTGSRECLGVEVEIEAEVPGESDDRPSGGSALVRARVDRLERDPDGRVVVVDFKTGTSQPRAADVEQHPQLGVYQWAVTRGAVTRGAVPEGGVSRLEPPSGTGGGVLVQLGLPGTAEAKEQWQPGLADSDDPDWPIALVRQVAGGLRTPTFAALVGPACGGCPVRSSCPAHPDGSRVIP